MVYLLTHLLDAIAINIDDAKGAGDAFPDANIISSHHSKRHTSPLSDTYLEIVKLHGEGTVIARILTHSLTHSLVQE